MKRVWVFNEVGSSQPSGVFRKLQSACDWAKTQQISGTITAYPVDISAYHWAVQNGHFRPSKPHHFLPALIQRFSPREPHFHFDGADNRITLDLEDIISDEYPETYDGAEVWVYVGQGASFPCAVFSSQALLEAWTDQYKIEGFWHKHVISILP